MAHDYVYPGQAFPPTHPFRLAAWGRLCGLNPPGFQDARVLELGCGCGANLVPLAASLPSCECVGIDMSESELQRGRTLADGLGLANLRLERADLRVFAAGLAPEVTFDYILCHGVFSWVDHDVQDAILELCGNRLSPCGLVYLNYNTHPGWLHHGLIRDLMRFEADGETEPARRVARGRAALQRLAQVLADDRSPFAQSVRQELATFAQRPDEFLFFGYLDQPNRPVYFHELAARAARAGLQYVTDAVAGRVERDGQPLSLHDEQWLDVRLNRMSRSSLFCRPTTAAVRSPAERLAELWFAARPDARIPEVFRAEAWFGVLGQAWPRSVPFAELQRESGFPPDRPAESLFRAASQGLIETTAAPFPLTTTIGDRPRAGRVARRQAASGSVVTNLRHESVQLGELERQLLPQLNGQAPVAATPDNRSALEHLAAWGLLEAT